MRVSKPGRGKLHRVNSSNGSFISDYENTTKINNFGTDCATIPLLIDNKNVNNDNELDNTSNQNSMEAKTHGSNSYYGTPGTKHHHITFTLMIIDAIGLGLIAICTIWEGYQMWGEFYSTNYQYNILVLSAWYAGRAAQTLGLIMLIIDVCGDTIGAFEAGGMYLLTIGPLINACAAYYFTDIKNDPLQLLNKKWIATEITELIGIILLDITCIKFADGHKYELLLLFIELLGYFVVALAAFLEYDFVNANVVSTAVTNVTNNITTTVMATVTAIAASNVDLEVDLDTSVTFECSEIVVAFLKWFPGLTDLSRLRLICSPVKVIDAFGVLLLAVVAVGHYYNLGQVSGHVETDSSSLNHRINKNKMISNNNNSGSREGVRKEQSIQLVTAV